MPWAAVGAIGGALISSSAAGDAADTQAAAAAGAEAGTQARFDETVKLNQPLINARDQSLSQLVAGTGAGGQFNQQFQYDPASDPSTQFRFQQGVNAVNANRATAGVLQSGGALKALTDYGQQSASQEYGNAYSRFNSDMTNRFNRLASVAGLGQTGANNVQTAGTAATSAINDYALQGANAQAAGTVGQANAVTGALSSLGNWWQNRDTGSPNSNGVTYGTSYGGAGVNQGAAGGDMGGSYWGIE